MSSVNLGFLPERIVGGETIWIAAANTLQDGEDVIIADVTPAGGYTLEYRFAAATPATVAAVANGGNTGWTLEVPGATTLTWTGNVPYVGVATKSSRYYAVDQGVIIVDPSPLRVSSWVAVLAAVDAAIATYAANPNGSVAIGDMSISYRSLSQLTELRDYVNYRLQQDNAARPKRIIRARFT